VCPVSTPNVQTDSVHPTCQLHLSISQIGSRPPVPIACGSPENAGQTLWAALVEYARASSSLALKDSLGRLPHFDLVVVVLPSPGQTSTQSTTVTQPTGGCIVPPDVLGTFCALNMRVAKAVLQAGFACDADPSCRMQGEAFLYQHLKHSPSPCPYGCLAAITTWRDYLRRSRRMGVHRDFWVALSRCFPSLASFAKSARVARQSAQCDSTSPQPARLAADPTDSC
jgi:hypothetical protein